MANRTFDALQVLGKGYKVIVGSFRPDTANALDSDYFLGHGWTAAYTTTGTFTITFTDKYADLIAFIPHLQQASDDDLIAKAGVYSASAKTQVVYVRDISGAALANVTSNANAKIHFVAVFKNSDVLPNWSK